MKKAALLLTILITLASCENGNNKSDAYGNFESDEVIVSSEAPGKLMKFNIEEGMTPVAGDTVGYVDTTQLHLQKELLLAKIRAIKTKYGSLYAQIEVLKEQIDVTNKDQSRIANMLKDGAATPKQMDDINGKLSVLQKQISQVQSQNPSIAADINTLQTQIESVNDLIHKSVIVNPIDGTVLNKYAEQYEITGAGKPLYKIARLDEITLRVYVSGAQLPHVKLRQKVKVFIDKNETENRQLPGEVYWISDQAEFTPKIIQTKDERVNMVYAVKIRVKNDGSMKIGMPGEVVF